MAEADSVRRLQLTHTEKLKEVTTKFLEGLDGRCSVRETRVYFE